MGSAVRARQEKKNKPAQLKQGQAPKKIGPIETALLVGIPIVFGLCISYLFSRAAAPRRIAVDGARGDAPRDTWFLRRRLVKRLRGDYMLGVFPKDAKGLKASILLMVIGRVGYVGLDLLKRRVKAVEARARADQAAAAPAAAAARKKDE